MENGLNLLLAVLVAGAILISGCVSQQEQQNPPIGPEQNQQGQPGQGQQQYVQQQNQQPQPGGQQPPQQEGEQLYSLPQQVQHCIGVKIGLPEFYDLAENRRAPSSGELDAINSCVADYRNPQGAQGNQTQGNSYNGSGGNAGSSGGQQFSPEKKGCEGSGDVQFTSPPRNLEDIGFIEPMGLMSENHVTPTDHQYYYPKNFHQDPSRSELSDVLAPADGVVSSVGRMPTIFSNKNPDFGDYRIIIYHTCTFYTIYIHVYLLSEKLQAAAGNLEPGQTAYPALPIKAGEAMGKGWAVDFSVHDEEKNLTGFIVPQHYVGEEWKIHTMDSFDYFAEPLRGQLLAKNLRTAEPFGGKIDYDIEGKLTGNWFLEGTNGYAGNRQPDYWVTHAAIVPDALDPSHIVVSLGDFGGKSVQYGVKGNSPNPADVSEQSGTVKYELVDWEYTMGEGGAYWNRITFAQGLKAKNQGEVRGVLLVQVLPDNRLKLEAFPGKTASQVSGFTQNAKIYER